ncbi:MAG TPA: penicillin-binding transpeptidase domain-containing protein [Verrucomicrobiae bacterium]|nr:penicillin-binding transpeptidase domain-containing protein [Verrucomicrobiae bacterium]
MLILDELKRNDAQLRLVAAMVALGLFVLLAGLWWVQVVSARKYQSHLETQAYRTVRVPAERGKILDREGRVLAENAPSYNLNLYLDDLGSDFRKEYAHLRPVKIVTNSPPFWKFWSRAKKVTKQRARLDSDQVDALAWQARYNVASKIASELSSDMGEPLKVDPADFKRHYATERAMSYPLLEDLDPAEIARFEEHYSSGLPVDLEMESQRVYPYGTTAAHLLGFVRKDDSSIEGEEAFFDYRLPDWRGVLGIEGGYDSYLHGHAGVESVLVNNLGYRQTANVWSAPEPGENVVLTLDLDVQRAAEQSLLAHRGPNSRAAIVVMNARNGDVLAMVSSPLINPIYNSNSPAYLADEKLKPQLNRATQQNYAPGSIFKPIVGLAALEAGLDPNALVDNPGYVYVGRRHITDLAEPGQYDLKKAIVHSSNTYFITIGLRTGIDKIVRMAEKFHFGERTGLTTRQETRGIFPSLKEVNSSDWHDGDSANICIGQGAMAVTPLQMAVAYSAIANGGTVFWPRLVERIEPQDPSTGETSTDYPSGLVRDRLGVSQHSLNVLHDAMLAETVEGTGQAAQVPGLKICGKTGTAEVMNEHNVRIDRTTWFASYAPYENPKYAVVVMVESGTFGGPTCAPIAHDIYEELLKKDPTIANVAKN